MNEAILALDLGTTTGWCVGTKTAHVSGRWDLKGGRHSGGGMRFVNFRKQLNSLHEAYPSIGTAYYEEVRRHLGTDAGQIYGGFLAILSAWCEEKGIPYEGVPVGEIKKAFTGKGNADKEAMITEAVFRGYVPIDDNEADAIALFCLKAGIASEIGAANVLKDAA